MPELAGAPVYPAPAILIANARVLAVRVTSSDSVRRIVSGVCTLAMAYPALRLRRPKVETR